MSVRAEIEAVARDATLNDDARRSAIYRLKATALLDVIVNGAPPLAPLLGREVTQAGATYKIVAASTDGNHSLILGLVVNGARHTAVIINPPIGPRNPTGHERRDMLQAATEMLQGFGA